MLSQHRQLYHNTALECSRLITRRYSTSFSLGIHMLDRKYHLPIYGIYGFVRYADEIVDTFHEHNKRDLLERFKVDTWKAIEEKISFNPVLHAYQLVVNQYNIEPELTEAFLHSMAMDLEEIDYDTNQYHTYIYGSAEVVGLMCLRVFCEGDEALYQKLKPTARSLGAAFQKVNFLRDIKSDFEERARVYFPGVDFSRFTAADKKLIEDDIQRDFQHALEGIKQLPKGSRLGVYLAYRYYLVLFNKIKRYPADKILKERVRIPDAAKIRVLMGSWLKMRIAGI